MGDSGGEGRGRLVVVSLAGAGVVAMLAGCDPGPIYSYYVENRCPVAVRADASDVRGVERIDTITDRPLVGPGETHKMYGGPTEPDRVYIYVSPASGAGQEVFTVEVSASEATPSEDPKRFSFTIPIEGEMCPG